MKKYFIILFLLALAIFISGCIGFLTTPGEDSIASGKGRLEIYLTDSPGDYKEVNIIISKIEGHIAVDGVENEEDWELLMEWTDGLLVDLTELEDVSILLASLELEPNKYTQLRIFLKDDEDEDDAWLVLNVSDSTKEVPFIPLVIPSVYQTGIKLIHPFEIREGKSTKLTIDFDAEKSIIKTDDGEYKLKPVIKVTSETYSVGYLTEYPGSISGSVADSEGVSIYEATVSVSLSSSEYIFTTSTVTEQDGSFFIGQLPVGTYTLTASADGYDEYTSEDGIEVTDGETININIELIKTESLN